MRPAQHPSNNDVLGAPPGTPIEDCKPLAITRVQYTNGIEGTWSFWRPSEAERKAIAGGALICLAAWGRTHPPIAVHVDGVKGDPW